MFAFATRGDDRVYSKFTQSPPRLRRQEIWSRYTRIGPLKPWSAGGAGEGNAYRKCQKLENSLHKT